MRSITNITVFNSFLGIVLCAGVAQAFYPIKPANTQEHDAIINIAEFNKKHHDLSIAHLKDGLHKRQEVVETVFPVEADDKKWHVRIWRDFDCPADQQPMEWSDTWWTGTGGCVRLDGIGRSFTLDGNVKGCVHYWYWDGTCSAPAEFSAVMGDIKCHIAPGGEGLQQLGSFQLKCPTRPKELVPVRGVLHP